MGLKSEISGVFFFFFLLVELLPKLDMLENEIGAADLCKARKTQHSARS